MESITCDNCGVKLEKRDYKKYGLRLIVSGILLFPLLFFISPGTIASETILIIFIVVGILFVRKKERYFYFCKKCKVKTTDKVRDENDEGIGV